MKERGMEKINPLSKRGAPIGVLDINGREIRDGDIISECRPGEIIWDGKGKILIPPTAKVIAGEEYESILWNKSIPAKAVRYFNGVVMLLEDTPFNQKGDTIEIYSSFYGEEYAAWDESYIVDADEPYYTQQHVYCTKCKFFNPRINADEDKMTVCEHEDVCDPHDFEDSKPLYERRFYEPREDDA